VSILVIGGAGYIGSHTADLCKKRGLDVVVFDSLELGHKVATEIVGVPFVYGDYGDLTALNKAIKEHSVDAVMHFGAYASVGDSVKDPAKYYESNIGKGLVLLRAVLDNGIKHFIFSSSAATYGEPQTIPIPEDHPQKTTNPYGETKLMFERILRDYDMAFGLKSVSLRYFNAAGADPDGRLGEDHTPEQHLIPLVVDTALGRRNEVKIFGTDWDTRDGTCLRDFVHVTDLADAHILALGYLRNGGATTAYNLGNSYGTTVREVIEATEKVAGTKVNAADAPRRPGDPGRLVASCDKIKAELKWEPKYPDIETIIRHAYEWRKSHPNGYGD
jgi:UDP-glucose 4-epimerase